MHAQPEETLPTFPLYKAFHKPGVLTTSLIMIILILTESFIRLTTLFYAVTQYNAVILHVHYVLSKKKNK